MAKRIVFQLIMLLIITSTVLAITLPLIDLGSGIGSRGETVTLPVTLTNVSGIDISAVGMDIGYDTDVLEKPAVSIGPAGSAAEKQVVMSTPSPGIIRVGLVGMNNTPIGNGVLANVTFTIKSTAKTGDTHLNFIPSASDPDGNPVDVTGSDGSLTVLVEYVPSSLTAKAISSTSIVLTWKDNSNNETGFKIERKVGGCNSTNDWKQIATKGANATTHTNTGLTANTTYSYRVRAYNSGGNSAYSNCASAKTGVAGSPNAPTNLSATSISANAIKICWTDSSTNATSFKIYRKVGTDSWDPPITIGADTGCYTDNTAFGNTSATTYSYYFQACNSSGCSPTTNTAIVPYRPTNLSVTPVSSSRINLTWTDKSINETGFQIYRKSGDCSSPSAWGLIATKGANSTSHSNTGLTTGQTYSYRMRAYYRTFARPYAYGYSSYSNCDDATTP